MRSRERSFVVACAAMAMLACGSPSSRNVGASLQGGNAARGKSESERYGCNACHAIGGLPAPTVAAVAPLTGIANQAYIAGTLANTPENLVKWIRFPQEAKPGTSMPDLAVSASDARDIATYLYSLR